jgi:hypothetical protein
LTAVLMFLAAELLAQDKGDSTDSTANPAADRREISKGLQQNVAKLDELIKLLKSGEAKVQVIDKQDKDKKD